MTWVWWLVRKAAWVAIGSLLVFGLLLVLKDRLMS